ncbi:MAG: M28 family peptidase [Gemmatimonadota bacterium]
MSDYDIPDLPSDEELGITEEDIRAFEAERAQESSGGGKGSEGSSPGGGKGGSQTGGGGPVGEGAAPSGGGAPGGDAPPGGSSASSQPASAPPPGPAPLRGLRGVLTLGALLAMTTVSTGWWATPSPAPANAPDTAFSSARAMTHLVEIARRPHPPGSPEHDRVRAFVLEQLRSMGLEPTVQTATAMIRGGNQVRAATLRNIVARIPGTASTGAILLTAHYDGRGISHAAGDDGMGVVAILEALRAFLAGPPAKNDLIVLITDGEELGLLGARAFVEQHPWLEDVQVVLSVEMRGGGGPSLMFETGARNGWIIRRFQAFDPAPTANSLGYEIYKRMPNDTDFTPLKGAGKQGLNYAAIGRAHLYHQAFDTPERVSEATLQHHGLHVMAMLRALKGEDLRAPLAPDVVYFRLPFVGLVVYDSVWILPLAALLLAVGLGVFLLVRRSGGSVGGIVVGAGLSILASALTWGMGYGLRAWLPRFHPEIGALHGSLMHHEGWYVLTLAAGAFAVVTLLFGIARRWYGLGVLTLGATLLPLLAALGASFAVPMGAMDLQWPVLATLAAAAVAAGVGPRARPGPLRWLILLALAFPVLAFLVFLVEFLWLGMTFSMAPWIGLLLAVLTMLTLPALDAVGEPNRWWPPLAGVLAAGAFLALGIRAARPSPDAPLPTTLLYVMDRGSGESLWATSPDRSTPSFEATRAWAEARTATQFAEERTLEPFMTRGRRYAVAPAPSVDAPGPEVSLALDSLAEKGRLIRVAVRSRIGAERILLRLPEEETPLLVAVNGRPLPEQGRRGAAVQTPLLIDHWGTPDPAAFFDFLIPANQDALSFAVVEHTFRPGDLVGSEVFVRPPYMAPNIVRMSDRGVFRTPVHLSLADSIAEATTPLTTDGVTPR